MNSLTNHQGCELRRVKDHIKDINKEIMNTLWIRLEKNNSVGIFDMITGELYANIKKIIRLFIGFHCSLLVSGYQLSPYLPFR
jgi:hypothetical protein